MFYEKIEISKCCSASVEWDFEENTNRKRYWCYKCERECDIEKVCSLCMGKGKVERLVTNSLGEADGYEDEVCICQLDHKDGALGDDELDQDR